MGLNRREFLTRTSLVAAGALSSHPLVGQQPAAPPAAPASFGPIRRNVGIFTARGGTIGWLIEPNALIVVDSQYPDTAQVCADGLKQKSTRRIDALINTHHHADHTGGNGVFKPLSAKIVGHARVPDLQRAAAAAANPPQDVVVPDTTYQTTWSMDAGGERVSLKYYGPGHTGGDTVVTFEKASIVHMGDLMFHRRHPRVDRAAGASMKNWIDLLGKVQKEHSADTVYIFGHSKTGLPATGSAKDLAAFASYLTAVLEHAQKEIKAGKSKEEITKLEALPGFDDFMSTPPVLTLPGVLAVAYDELTNAKTG